MSEQVIAPSDSSLQGQYAGFVTRFGALLIDFLLVLATTVIIGISIDFLLRFFNLYDFLQQVVANLTARSDFLAILFRILASFATFYFIFFLYYVTLHTAAAGITIGKAVMGLRVVRMDGVPLTFGRCTRRYLTFLLTALPLFAGQLWVIVDDRRQGWHDKLSNTCVIYDWPAHEDENFLSGLKYRLRYVQQTRRRFGVGTGSNQQSNS